MHAEAEGLFSNLEKDGTGTNWEDDDQNYKWRVKQKERVMCKQLFDSCWLLCLTLQSQTEGACDDSSGSGLRHGRGISHGWSLGNATCCVASDCCDGRGLNSWDCCWDSEEEDHRCHHSRQVCFFSFVLGHDVCDSQCASHPLSVMMFATIGALLFLCAWWWCLQLSAHFSFFVLGDVICDYWENCFLRMFKG